MFVVTGVFGGSVAVWIGVYVGMIAELAGLEDVGDWESPDYGHDSGEVWSVGKGGMVQGGRCTSDDDAAVSGVFPAVGNELAAAQVGVLFAEDAEGFRGGGGTFEDEVKLVDGVVGAEVGVPTVAGACFAGFAVVAGVGYGVAAPEMCVCADEVG